MNGFGGLIECVPHPSWLLVTFNALKQTDKWTNLLVHLDFGKLLFLACARLSFNHSAHFQDLHTLECVENPWSENFLDFWTTLILQFPPIFCKNSIILLNLEWVKNIFRVRILFLIWCFFRAADTFLKSPKSYKMPKTLYVVGAQIFGAVAAAALVDNDVDPKCRRESVHLIINPLQILLPLLQISSTWGNSPKVSEPLNWPNRDK